MCVFYFSVKKDARRSANLVRVGFLHRDRHRWFVLHLVVRHAYTCNRINAHHDTRPSLLIFTIRDRIHESVLETLGGAHGVQLCVIVL